MFREGILVIISGPSGTGKGTLVKKLIEYNTNIKISVSVTTRKPREGEVDGQNYFFTERAHFEAMVANNELLEWVEYCGNCYGTPKTNVEKLLKEGFDVILEIDVIGALKVKEKFKDSVSIFVLPPTFDELTKRIVGRGTEKPDVIEQRLNKAKDEIKLVDKYDYAIINDDIREAIEDIRGIISSEKNKVIRNVEYIYDIIKKYN